MQRWILRSMLVLAALAAGASTTIASAQVTTGSVRGVVTDSDNRPIEGARIQAVHLPSGTQYTGATRADGRFNIPGMRVGGPYSVTATMIGYARQSREDITVTLGTASDLIFRMSAVATQLSAVTVTSEGGELSSTRTGAATTVRRDALEKLPTISRNLQDFTRLTPESRGTSFAGADGRLNNITVDGAQFNNSFGLGDGQPGGRTGTAPISIDAIEAVQVNIAPYDVRQGAFVGAAVNTVTRSGTNDFQGSAYYLTRNQDMVGRRAGSQPFDPGSFAYDQVGFRLGGPIIQNKLFFFVNYETDGLESPATTLRANRGGEPEGGNVTRVLESDLQTIRQALIDGIGFDPGGWEGYSAERPSSRLVAKLDFALSERNKFSFRYSNLDASDASLVSNSRSAGFGDRRAPFTTALNFTSANYEQLEKISTVVGEWNSLITDRMSNQMIVSYSSHDESRGAAARIPFVDILLSETEGTYTSFGTDPFTPNNELRYKSFNFQNNFTIYTGRHDLTFGLAVERYRSENVFFPTSNGVFSYNSVSDFLTDLNDYVANPTRTTSPVVLRRYQLRYSNITGLDKPLQPLEVTSTSLYAQDEWRPRNNVTVTMGLRLDSPSFGDTGFDNPAVDAMDFRDENGNTVGYSTKKLPDTQVLFSPRVGINWDVKGNGVTRVRGGTGLFAGRPLYVWLSNQIGENGMLTGFEQLDSVTTRPFHPDPDRYKPAPADAPAPSYGLAFTDPDFRFPQVLRTNLAVDHRFNNGLLLTTEFIVTNDVNGIYYINANLPAANGAFTGVDDRPRWTAGASACSNATRINCNISGAFVMKNQSVGRAYTASIGLERSFNNGFYAKVATAYGDARNNFNPGNIAFGSWSGNAHPGDPNNPGLGFSTDRLGRRTFGVVSHTRDWFGWGATSISAFIDSRMGGTASYIYGSDLNGDGTSNDLIYVPRDISEMNFHPFTSGGVTYTAADQAAAWERFIQQDKYLNSRRGKYAERNGVSLPQITRMDLSVSQDLTRMLGTSKNTLQLRLDILNFTNMINSEWGRGQVLLTNSPLLPRASNQGGPADGTGRAIHTMRVISGQLASRSFQKTATQFDVWQMQLGFRYTFN